MSEMLARSPFVKFVVEQLIKNVDHEAILEMAVEKFKGSCVGKHNIAQVATAYKMGVYASELKQLGGHNDQPAESN